MMNGSYRKGSCLIRTASAFSILLVLHVVASAQILSGTVTDADSGKPIESFKVVYATRDVILPNRLPSMAGAASSDGKSRKYELAMNLPTSQRQMVVRIEAEGYVPVLSPVIQVPLGRNAMSRSNERCVFDTALKRALNVTGTVRLASGAAAPGARVIVCVPEFPVVVENGQVQPRRGQGISAAAAALPPYAGVRSVVADNEGKFSVPPDREGFVLLVLHEQGVARVNSASGGDNLSITLDPWGTVTGFAIRGGAPAGGALVGMSSPYGDAIRLVYETTTDQDGSFGFDRVAPGEFAAAMIVRSILGSDGTGIPSSVHPNVRVAAGATVEARLSDAPATAPANQTMNIEVLPDGKFVFNMRNVLVNAVLMESTRVLGYSLIAPDGLRIEGQIRIMVSPPEGITREEAVKLLKAALAQLNYTITPEPQRNTVLRLERLAPATGKEP